jgi:hypothetical protein
MSDDFDLIERTFRSEGAEAALEVVLRQSRESGRHQALFNARVMQVRRRLGLPLIETGPVSDIREDQRPQYDAALCQAARECGEMCLRAGEIPAAYAYFKALGDSAPVAAAIENVTGGDDLDRIVQIAFQEGVNPRKGFELILEHRGVCNAISWVGAIRDFDARQKCVALLVRTLHGEVLLRMKETIAANEGTAPETGSLMTLMDGRAWLFEGAGSYVDSTHLASLLRFTPELDDRQTLELALELAEYGSRLDPMFHFRGDPPFEDIYRDYAVYLKALLGREMDEAVEHFRRKMVDAGEPGAPEVVIDLLVRLGRMRDAIATSLEQFPDPHTNPAGCPTAAQLCQMAGEFEQLRNLARSRGDLLSFAAGVIQGS